MRRGEFIALMGTSVAWPFAALAQAGESGALPDFRSPPAMPQDDCSRRRQHARFLMPFWHQP